MIFSKNGGKTRILILLFNVKINKYSKWTQF